MVVLYGGLLPPLRPARGPARRRGAAHQVRRDNDLFTKMTLAVGALALALCLGTGAGVYAQDQQNNPTPTPGASSPSGAQDMQNGTDMGRRGRRGRRADRMGGDMNQSSGTMAEPGAMNWSRRYQLTPLDQKRLQAMGLTKEEVWAVAKAAHESNRDVDDVAQMVLRGRSYFQIADELNIPYSSLLRWPQRWQSAEWADEVKEGSPVWYAHSAGMSGENGGMNQGGMRERGSMPEGVQRVSAPTCPACGMKLSTTETAANPRAVVISGTTYYCCAGCDMSKTQQ